MALPQFSPGEEALAADMNAISQGAQDALDRNPPAGGAQGQVLGKTGPDDWAMGWVDGGGGGSGLPDGGTTGQLLGKLSDADQDVGWLDPPAAGGGGTVLAYSNGTNVANITTATILPASQRVLPVKAGQTYLAQFWVPLSIGTAGTGTTLDTLTARLTLNGTAIMNASWRLAASTAPNPAGIRIALSSTALWTPAADGGTFGIQVLPAAGQSLNTYAAATGTTMSHYGYSFTPVETGTAP